MSISDSQVNSSLVEYPPVANPLTANPSVADSPLPVSPAECSAVAVEPLSYARTENRNAPRVWAGIAILFAGVALIVIAGCFLIGVMAVLTQNTGAFSFQPTPPAPHNLTLGDVVLITVLYVLSAGALIGGILVIVTGLRSLLHIIRS
jgi:hypothetical protein